MLEQGPGDAQPLLLPAGDVGAPLLDPGVVAVGEALDELVGAGLAADLGALLFRGVLLAPAEVVQDGAGEEDVLLQHHRHLLAQGLQVVGPHVLAAHGHGAAVHVVEPADEADQAALTAAGTPHDADGLPSLDVQVDVPENRLPAALAVGEGDVGKVDATVLHLVDGLGGIGQVGLLCEDLADAAGAGQAHGHHHHDHGEHHQGHEDAHDIGGQGGELPGGEVSRHHELGAEPGQGDDTAIDHQHHHRVVQGQDALGFHEEAVEGVGGLLKLLVLIVLPDEGLHHPDGGDVLLDAGVEVVVPVKDLLEQGQGDRHDDPQGHHQHHHGHQEDQAQPGADQEAQDQGGQQHQGGADADP